MTSKIQVGLAILEAIENRDTCYVAKYIEACEKTMDNNSPRGSFSRTVRAFKLKHDALLMCKIVELGGSL